MNIRAVVRRPSRGSSLGPSAASLARASISLRPVIGWRGAGGADAARPGILAASATEDEHRTGGAARHPRGGSEQHRSPTRCRGCEEDEVGVGMRCGFQYAPVDGSCFDVMLGVVHARDLVRKRGQSCSGRFEKLIRGTRRAPRAGDHAPVGQHRCHRQRCAETAAKFGGERKQSQGARTPVGIDGNKYVAEQVGLLCEWRQLSRRTASHGETRQKRAGAP